MIAYLLSLLQKSICESSEGRFEFTVKGRMAKRALSALDDIKKLGWIVYSWNDDDNILTISFQPREDVWEGDVRPCFYWAYLNDIERIASEFGRVNERTTLLERIRDAEIDLYQTAYINLGSDVLRRNVNDLMSNQVQEESPVVQEESPVVQEESPVVREESPVVQEESPVVQEERPVVQEESEQEVVIEHYQPMLLCITEIVVDVDLSSPFSYSISSGVS